MKHLPGNYDVIVVGGGHAGVEAAWSIANKDLKCCIVTMDVSAVGRMSCNPAIGGLAKGQMVREIDVLGGLMARTADLSGLQFKILNQSKGRSVWSPRAQVDKRVYENILKKTVANNKNISVVQGEVVSLTVSKNKVSSVSLRTGEVVFCSSLVVTCGTFLSGLIHVGDRKIRAGRMGEVGAEGITESLVNLGFKTARLKTGTPPRALKKSINWKLCEPVYGDKNPMPFSYQTRSFTPPNEACYTVRTTEESHALIIKNTHLSPMYSGEITGTGPRYCPSIEDKVKRFSDHKSHLLFLEPEWRDSDQIYINGFSTSLPEEIQIESLKKIEAFKDIEFLRPGYAIEYDFFPPMQLKQTLESKDVSGLFFAGQINGTSGYEEAGAQGLVAGVNASAYVKNEEPLTLGRKDAYIGVMIDDLITKDTLEPYRMFTSRAEHRLILRYSNADIRLFDLAKQKKLLTRESLETLEERNQNRAIISTCLDISISPEDIPSENLKQKTPLKKLLKRPEVSLLSFNVSIPEKIKKSEPAWSIQEMLLDCETDVKYEGYIKRSEKEIRAQEKNENLKLKIDIDYHKVVGLSNEAKEKLSAVRPQTLGQAQRISGVNPVDITVLMVYFF